MSSIKNLCAVGLAEELAVTHNNIARLESRIKRDKQMIGGLQQRLHWIKTYQYLDRLGVRQAGATSHD
jgi:hypothetical protein